MKPDKEHHPFCNYNKGPVEECRFCPRYFKLYPHKKEDPEELILKYFPNVTVIK